MQICPFELISCSWPRAIQQENQQWSSEPEWNGPLMSVHPNLSIELKKQEWCWCINWNNFFRCDLSPAYFEGREMRGFHVVFRLRMKGSGSFVVFEEEGCIIRRNHEILHENKGARSQERVTINVQAGDILDVAQWHKQGEWTWGAYLQSFNQSDFASPDPIEVLTPYLEIVKERLSQPQGPVLKIYTNGSVPVRVATGIYSFILNGYVPSAVYLFGDHQWHRTERELLKRLLPFAQIVTTREILSHIRAFSDGRFIEQAVRNWYVMKIVAALLYPPNEFCFMDDDVFILDHMQDALEAFQTHNLVFTTNFDHGREYIEMWKTSFPDVPDPLPTARFNAGLYWLRNTINPHTLAVQLSSVAPTRRPQDWEQGFMAMAYAQERHFELPFHRYYAPAINGMPGGTYDYDYIHNPCGFASLHYLGVAKYDKPSNGQTLSLVPKLLHG